MKQEKIYVVEGAHDASKLKEYDKNIKVIYTGGIRIKKALIDQLKMLEKTHEIVLLLDPDFAGENIRKKLNENLLKPTHIYLKKEHSTSKKGDIGLEHVKIEHLEELLSKSHKITTLGDIDNAYLLSKGYIGHKDSKRMRVDLFNYFRIGYTNGKGLAKRLNLYNITREKISNYEKEEKIRTALFDEQTSN